MPVRILISNADQVEADLADVHHQAFRRVSHAFYFREGKEKVGHTSTPLSQSSNAMEASSVAEACSLRGWVDAESDIDR